MFFKKKPQTQAESQLFIVFPEIAKTLYYGMTEDDTAELSATLEFDELQRVSGVNNLLVNGMPKVPPMNVVEAISNITSQFQSLPKLHKLKALVVTVKDGDIKTNAEYMK